MDESLKARLIGGAVLVAIVVLLVPEILSGRKASQPEPDATAGARGTRTYTIDLGGGAPVQLAPEPVPAQPAPAVKPEPEPQPEPKGPPEPQPAPVQATEPAAKTEPVPEPASAPRAPPASVAKGGWAVQVGAFGSADAARKLVRELGAAGFEAYESPVSRSGKTLHRVRVGPEADRADADRLAVRLKARSLPATVVAND